MHYVDCWILYSKFLKIGMTILDTTDELCDSGWLKSILYKFMMAFFLWLLGKVCGNAVGSSSTIRGDRRPATAGRSRRDGSIARRLMSRRVRLNCTHHSYSPAIYFIFASDRALLSVFLSYCLRGSIIHVLLLANETHGNVLLLARSWCRHE